MSNRRYLSTVLRRSLETAIRGARKIAEDGASDEIRRLGVSDAKAPTYLSTSEKEFRRQLRAHARALGDSFNKASDRQETKHLTEAAAYAHWHRMLFARFLAERGLLRHPVHDAAVTLEDCRDLAAEEGLLDGWAVAERYAAAMLPGVFRIDDPVLALVLDAVHAQGLQRLVVDLDSDIFQAEDSLGWTYQFWRAAEKDAVNKSGRKIGVDELPAVTQLFTEPYMVRFLLHNTLGAWWAGKRLAADELLAETAPDEETLRMACAFPAYSFDMLRFVKEESAADGSKPTRWRPAAGIFSGWPTEAKALTVLDPCCGSGHFLTEALAALVALRQAEEKLSSAEAVAAVLRDNLYGLEIDGRCVQIAAFAVALAAWRIGGWQPLPLPHIAWVGAPPPLPRAEFIGLGGGNKELELALGALHDLFAQAPILGSLLAPTGGDLVDPMRVARVEQLLGTVLAKARKAEPEQIEGAIAARGMTDATSLLCRRYTLQITNVPFLGRAKQCDELARYIDSNYRHARADLSTTMLWRLNSLCSEGGTFSAVTPQNWLHLGSYRKFRLDLLESDLFNFIIDLGPAAFREMNWWAARTSIVAFSKGKISEDHTFVGLDADTGREFDKRPDALCQRRLLSISQRNQFKNPDNRIVLSTEWGSTLLSHIADYGKGSTTGDGPRFIMNFWELGSQHQNYELWLNSPEVEDPWGGRSNFLRCKHTETELKAQLGCWFRGQNNWGRRGFAVNKMRNLYAFFYDGELFDDNVATVVPRSNDDAPAVGAFLTSKNYREEVRKIDQKVSVTAATLTKVAFDLETWKQRASEKFPNGLPEPFSDDPTQWLFHGHPLGARRGTSLHVALARLVGYRWPAETNSKIRLSRQAQDWVAKAAKLPDPDGDGLLPLCPVAGKRALADRLREYLSAVFGSDWSDELERRLIAESDEALDGKSARDGSIEGWLRDRAFRQHCTLFYQRPFLWHIWDKQKDGFSVITNYHQLDQATLRKLAYTLLGDWLSRSRAEKNELRYEKGRELQQALERILEGENPYDIFVRWKSLAQLPRLGARSR